MRKQILQEVMEHHTCPIFLESPVHEYINNDDPMCQIQKCPKFCNCKLGSNTLWELFTPGLIHSARYVILTKGDKVKHPSVTLVNWGPIHFGVFLLGRLLRVHGGGRGNNFCSVCNIKLVFVYLHVTHPRSLFLRSSYHYHLKNIAY